jgi:hypothetical protein
VHYARPASRSSPWTGASVQESVEAGEARLVRERRVSSADPQSAAIENDGRTPRASRLDASLDRMALAGLIPLGLPLRARRSRTQRPAPDRRRQAPCSSIRPQARRPPAPQPRQAGAAAGHRRCAPAAPTFVSKVGGQRRRAPSAEAKPASRGASDATSSPSVRSDGRLSGRGVTAGRAAGTKDTTDARRSGADHFSSVQANRDWLGRPDGRGCCQTLFLERACRCDGKKYANVAPSTK